MATTKRTTKPTTKGAAPGSPRAPKKTAPAAAAPAKELPPASTVSPELLVGKRAPELDLEAEPGKRVRIADFEGKKIVLYFYPKDDTPGCTLEAQDFEAARAAFARKNAVVIGVSRDSLAAHARFRGKHALGFQLLSDPDARVLRAYGAWAEKTLYGKRSLGIVRTTFVIDEAGKVVAAFPKVKVAGHVDAVLAIVS
jgi:peroxiredoxin Q/BCP